MTPQSGSTEALQKDNGSTTPFETQKANDYQPLAVACVPESVTAATINAENEKYWGTGPASVR